MVCVCGELTRRLTELLEWQQAAFLQITELQARVRELEREAVLQDRMSEARMKAMYAYVAVRALGSYSASLKFALRQISYHTGWGRGDGQGPAPGASHSNRAHFCGVMCAKAGAKSGLSTPPPPPCARTARVQTEELLRRARKSIPNERLQLSIDLALSSIVLLFYYSVILGFICGLRSSDDRERLANQPHTPLRIRVCSLHFACWSSYRVLMVFSRDSDGIPLF